MGDISININIYLCLHTTKKVDSTIEHERKIFYIFHQLLQGVVLGVGQIFACDTLGPSLLILGAVFLFSPILAVHALLGSVISTVAGKSKRNKKTIFAGLLFCLK